MSRYDVIDVIGRGATSVVYRAHDRLLDRAVALKEVQFEGAGEIAVAEARAAAKISHPNVVTVHDVFIEDDRRLIAMELLEGPTLRELVDSEGVLGFDRGLAIAHQVATSLAAAHAVGVVHRDIKPDNIFVLRGNRAVVSDFGMALASLRGGTPGYMAPEQWNGDDAGPPADVFAWGCVLTECLTGAPPFGSNEDEARQRTLVGDAVVALGWPALETLVLRCLAVDERRRPADGSVLVQEFESLGGLPTVPVVGSIDSQSMTSRCLEPLLSEPRVGLGTAGVIRLLVYPSDEQPVWEMWLDPAMGTVDFGREGDVVLPDPMVSRRHARFESGTSGWVVTDLGSMNGTIKNGAPIEQAPLELGDVVVLGSTVIRIDGA